MTAPSKISNLAAFAKVKSFSPVTISDKKIASAETCEKIGEGPENKGLQVHSPTPTWGKSGETPPKKKMTPKMKATPSPPYKQPKLSPSPGPEGHLHDCNTMNPTQLRLAYPGEYTSWRLRKSHCKKHDWSWDPAWNEFRDFLRDMGPKPDPADTLDRLDNDKLAYGPNLCRWASKAVQNNNKSDNVKITIPLTGEVWTVRKLAKLHAVQPKTIYKWKANYYSPLELLAGKKSQPLLALNVALDELPETIKTKAKPPAKKFKIPPPPKYVEWDPTDEEYDHYQATGERLDSRFTEMQAEYEAATEWMNRFNAGLPHSPEPPQGKDYKFSNPANHENHLKASAPAPPEPEAVPDEEADLPEEDDGFDPDDDCVPGYDGFDPADCVPDYDEYD